MFAIPDIKFAVVLKRIWKNAYIVFERESLNGDVYAFFGM